MFGLFCNDNSDKIKYRIQTSGANDAGNYFIVQKYQECVMGGSPFWAWQDYAKFDTLEQAKACIADRPKGKRQTVYIGI